MKKIFRFSNLIYDELVLVKQEKVNQSNDRPEATNKLRKLLFFSLSEGLLRTFSKVQSKSNSTFLIDKYKTTLKIKYNNQYYINFSTQTSENLEDFVIRNSFYKIQKNAKSDFDELEISYNQYLDDTLKFKKFREIIALEEEKDNSEASLNLKQSEGVFIYGLGDYSRVYIAPNIKKINKICCVDYVSKLSDHYKARYKYKYNGLVPEDSFRYLKEIDNPLAIIATYHSDHTRIASQIFKQNPNTLIFIEKPPCVTLEDIDELIRLYKGGAKIEIGYNRRFIDLNKKIKERLKDKRAIINISVKEILINNNHWYFWENQGTRITGNLTHWIDLSIFWLEDEVPKEITLLQSDSKDETFTASILFDKGSLLNLTVSDKGNSLRGVQEKIEIRTDDETFFIDDYKKGYIINNNGKKNRFNNINRVKGHDQMYKNLVNQYYGKSTVKYTSKDLIKTAMTTYFLSKMFRSNTNYLKIEDEIKKQLIS